MKNVLLPADEKGQLWEVEGYQPWSSQAEPILEGCVALGAALFQLPLG